MSNGARQQKRKQALQKYLVFTLMFLVFAGCIWLIFAPSEKDRQEQAHRQGFNTELPDPKNAGIVENKMDAYEQEAARRKQEDKMRSLEEFTQDHAASTGERDGDAVSQAVNVNDLPEETLPQGAGRTTAAIPYSSSRSAYNRINETLGSFYEQPQEDPEKEALKAEVELLRQQAAQQQALQPSYAEQVALLEKSYELAAKYMPAGGNNARQEAEGEPAGRNGKPKAAPVGLVSKPLVSSLAQPVSDSVLIARLSEPRNRSFHTAVGETGSTGKNTVSACVHGDQTVVSGQSVRLRLLEAMRVGSHVLPRNSLLTGDGRIQGERLAISISQVEYAGNIIPVELKAYDNDGQPGIFIPGSMEASAMKEVAANLGQNLGTTISITNQSAGDQLLSELGKGAIQGVSQYISKKMRQEKVHLKSGYTLMLYQDNN